MLFKVTVKQRGSLSSESEWKGACLRRCGHACSVVGIQNGLLRTKSPIGVEPASIGTAESDLAKLMEGTGGAALVVVSSANGALQALLGSRGDVFIWSNATNEDVAAKHVVIHTRIPKTNFDTETLLETDNDPCIAISNCRNFIAVLSDFKLHVGVASPVCQRTDTEAEYNWLLYSLADPASKSKVAVTSECKYLSWIENTKSGLPELKCSIGYTALDATGSNRVHLKLDIFSFTSQQRRETFDGLGQTLSTPLTLPAGIGEVLSDSGSLPFLGDSQVLLRQNARLGLTSSHSAVLDSLTRISEDEGAILGSVETVTKSHSPSSQPVILCHNNKKHGWIGMGLNSNTLKQMKLQLLTSNLDHALSLPYAEAIDIRCGKEDISLLDATL